MQIAVDGILLGTNIGLSPEGFVNLVSCAEADGVHWPFMKGFGIENPERIAKLVENAGLKFIAVWMTEHILAIPGEEERCRNAFKSAMDIASVCGAPVIDCWPYMPAESAEIKDCLKTLSYNLDALEPIAEKPGITISLEFHPDAVLRRYSESIRFVQNRGKFIKLTADTYHIQRVGDDPVSGVREICNKPEIGGTCANDETRNRLGLLHFSASHRGEVGSKGDACDYMGCLKAASESGYKGDVVIQYKTDEDIKTSLKRAVGYTRGLINDLKRQ